MNVNSIFLDPKTLEETNGTYGIVTQTMSNFNTQQRFTDQYLGKFMLVDEIQKMLNDTAAALIDLPDEAGREAATAEWRVLKTILDEVKAL